MATFNEFAKALRKLNFRRLPMTGAFTKSKITFATGLDDALAQNYWIRMDAGEFGTYQFPATTMSALTEKACAICRGNLTTALLNKCSKRTIRDIEKQIRVLNDVRSSFVA